MNFRRGERGPSSLNRNNISKPLLLIEDSRSIANIIKSQVENRWGCDVHVASSYEEAITLLKAHRREYFLTISDLNLPDAPNGEIVELLKRTGLPIIVITGTMEKGHFHKSLHTHVVDFILKSQTNSVQYLIDQVGRFYFNQFTTLMIVDDSKLSREVITQVLETQNFKVVNAGSAEEALSLIESTPEIKLIVSDYIMPNMNGVELTTELRKKYAKSKLSIIGLSSDNEPRLGLEFIRNGANDFLTKPFIAEELIMRINQNLDTMSYIEVIENSANRDYLTNLHNRRYFYRKGEKLLADSKKQNKPFVTALLDIDHFKKINDTYGHDVGDKVLIQLAIFINNHFSHTLSARVGGEEFAILFQEPLPSVLDQLEAFRKELAETTLEFGGNTFNVTTSIGCTDALSTSLDDSLKAADLCLYDAKKQGRNTIVHQAC
ncbi:GGDEF domain-containing response regulator [Alteromonas sp. a30]|uniref:GGDEF domain-containing response regulator n=1 Tax=Alteromonas sp. a30 TaxID=2730917 RepID=UPI0022821977|nr:response regulator [Alteromonas sp. a30]MCY7294439.1 diguanylate cyclase [Alteromonas sp. a30]